MLPELMSYLSAFLNNFVRTCPAAGQMEPLTSACQAYDFTTPRLRPLAQVQDSCRQQKVMDALLSKLNLVSLRACKLVRNFLPIQLLYHMTL